MARTTEKVTQQTITKLQNLMNASGKNAKDAYTTAEVMKESNPDVAQLLLTSAAKFAEDYQYLAGKIIRRLTDGLTDSPVTLNKWIDSVKSNLPQA